MENQGNSFTGKIKEVEGGRELKINENKEIAIGA